jgi:hypothetical protein
MSRNCGVRVNTAVADDRNLFRADPAFAGRGRRARRVQKDRNDSHTKTIRKPMSSHNRGTGCRTGKHHWWPVGSAYRRCFITRDGFARTWRAKQTNPSQRGFVIRRVHVPQLRGSCESSRAGARTTPLSRFHLSGVALGLRGMLACRTNLRTTCPDFQTLISHFPIQSSTTSRYSCRRKSSLRRRCKFPLSTVCSRPY